MPGEVLRAGWQRVEIHCRDHQGRMIFGPVELSNDAAEELINYMGVLLSREIKED